MFVVGLTGGIGSGKTVASDHFTDLGATVIDTDVIARQVVEPGQPTLNSLANTFGTDILKNNGRLDRAALRKIAFSSAENKRKLDSITHPAIRLETANQINQCDFPYCVVVVPLLTADSPFSEVMQRIIVVTAHRETKIERVKKRSNLSMEEVERIMATQLDDQERLEFADDIITNDGTIADVHERVEELHDMYIQLSASLA